MPIVLLYGLGALFIVLNLISSIVWTDAILLQKPSVVFPDSEVIFGISNDAGNESSSLFDFFLSSLYYFQFAYVLLISGGTVLLLYHNFKRIGRIKFWVLVSLPTLIFLSTTLTIYQQINPTGLVAQATPIDYMIPILLMNYSALAVGVIFGLSFILVGRFLKQGIHSRAYILIAGLGFILFLWANGATLIQTAYPSYGIATVSAVPLSLFMILYGLSYSAISVAQDETLRRSIRKNVKDMIFLDSIGTAQMEKEFEKKVLDITKKSSEIMIEESGVQPSLSEDDMKRYLQQVLQEVKADKT